MAVDDPNVVDFVGTDRTTSGVVLVISDHLPWADPTHFEVLERKLGGYLEYVRSGKLWTDRPAVKGKPVEVRVVCQYAPDKKAVAFFELAKTIAQEHGLTLTYGEIPGEYLD